MAVSTTASPVNYGQATPRPKTEDITKSSTLPTSLQPPKKPFVHSSPPRTSGTNVIKLFAVVIYDFNRKVFVRGRPFQSSHSRTFEMFLSWVSYWPYPQILDQAGKTFLPSTKRLVYYEH